MTPLQIFISKRVDFLLQTLFVEQKAQSSLPPRSRLEGVLLVIPFLRISDSINLLKWVQGRVSRGVMQDWLLKIVLNQDKIQKKEFCQLLLLSARTNLLIRQFPKKYGQFIGSAKTSLLEADLQRVLGDFNEYQQARLANVLQALSNSLPGGYFQGLSFPLCFLNELPIKQEQMFWTMLHLYKKRNLIQLVKDNLIKYRYFEVLIARSLQLLLPQFSLALEVNTPGLGYFVLRWVITLLSQQLDFQFVCRVWLVISLGGVSALVGLILAVFKSFGPVSPSQLTQQLKHNLSFNMQFTGKQFARWAVRLTPSPQIVQLALKSPFRLRLRREEEWRVRLADQQTSSSESKSNGESECSSEVQKSEWVSEVCSRDCEESSIWRKLSEFW